VSASQEQLDRLVRRVRAGIKYDRVVPALVERIVRQELAIREGSKEAVKATKRKLHQVTAAYYERSPNYATWYQQLEGAAVEGDGALRQACRQVMAAHASTRERLPILEAFYETVLADLAPITSIADLACGLNPLAIPWMPLQESTSYYACDVYTDMVEFLQRCFDLWDVRGKALACDVLGDLPIPDVQVALLLKSLPCLEQLDREATRRLLERIPAQRIVVSYPAQSLGGQDKGMIEHYSEAFHEQVAGHAWGIQRHLFNTELVFIVDKTAGS